MEGGGVHNVVSWAASLTKEDVVTFPVLGIKDPCLLYAMDCLPSHVHLAHGSTWHRQGIQPCDTDAAFNMLDRIQRTNRSKTGGGEKSSRGTLATFESFGFSCCPQYSYNLRQYGQASHTQASWEALLADVGRFQGVVAKNIT